MRDNKIQLKLAWWCQQARLHNLLHIKAALRAAWDQDFLAREKSPQTQGMGLNPEKLFAFVWLPLHPQIPQFTVSFVSDLCLSAGVWNPCNHQLRPFPHSSTRSMLCPSYTVPPSYSHLHQRISRQPHSDLEETQRKDSQSPHCWRSPTERENLGGCSPLAAVGIALPEGAAAFASRAWVCLNFRCWI